MVNRRNISADVKNKYKACKQFFFLEVTARVLAAALKTLHIKSVHELPSDEDLPVFLQENSDMEEKRLFLRNLSCKIVDDFIDNQVTQLNIVEQQKYSDWLKTCNPQNAEGLYECRFETCRKLFKHDGKIRKEHEKSHGLHQLITNINQQSDDDMLNYQCSLLEYGMLQLHFHDAISEGDGARVLRCWKFMMPYLHKDGASSRKYALECLYLIFQYYALLSPKDAHSLIWNRFHKAKTGLGEHGAQISKKVGVKFCYIFL